MRRSVRYCLHVAVSMILLWPAFSQQTGPLSLDTLIAEALKNNPQLRAARSQSAAVRARVGQSTSWEDLQIGVEFFQTPISSFPNPLKDWMENDYFVQQMIPFPGKLSAAGDATGNEANMAEQEYHAVEKKVIRDIKAAYYDLYLVQRKIQINADNQDLVRQFERIASKQYEVGTGEHHEVLRAQVELSSLINDGVILQQEKNGAEAMLNTLLSRSTDSTLGYVPDPDISLPPLTFEQLKPLALEARPEIHAMNYAIEMNRDELTRSNREYLPDFMVRLAYKDVADTKDDFWSAMVGINVPVPFLSLQKYSGMVEENELGVKRAEDEALSMKNMALFEVQDALVRVQTSMNLVLLYKNTVIPQARQTLETTIIAYQTGRSMFLWLIDSYRTLLNTQLAYHESVMNFMKSQAELERSVGMNMEEIRERIH